MKVILSTLLAIFLASCAGTGKNLQILMEDMESDQTLVFVKRSTGFFGSAPTIQIKLNGQEVARLGSNESTSVPGKTGQNVLNVGYTGLASIGMNRPSKQFQLDEGGKKFFIIKQDVKIIGPPELKLYMLDKDDFFSD